MRACTFKGPPTLEGSITSQTQCISCACNSVQPRGIYIHHHVYIFLLPLSLLHGSSLFASHLCEYLSQHTLQPPDSFLTHQASLHILMAISKCMVRPWESCSRHYLGCRGVWGGVAEVCKAHSEDASSLTADQRER